MKISITNQGVFNFLPYSPLANAEESWSYDVFLEKTVDGGEYRVLKSDAPDRVKKLNFTVGREDAEYIKQAVFYGSAENWIIPCFEMQKTLPMTGDEFDLNNLFNLTPFGGQFMFLIITMDGQFIIHDSYYISLNNQLYGAKIIPFEKGFIKQNLSINTDSSGSRTSISIEFKITDYMLPSPMAFTQYDGYDFVDKFFLSLKRGMTSKYDLVKNIGTGDFSFEANYGTDWERPDITYDFRFLAKSAEEVMAFKQFMQRRCGTLRPFWRAFIELQMMPLSSGTSIQVKDASGYLYSLDYKHLVFFDGLNWTPRRILNKTRVGTETTFIIDEPVTEQNEVYFLTLQRLANNGVNITWLGNGVAECSTSVMDMAKGD